jgi:polar amino acid transport system substrate-binding protein
VRSRADGVTSRPGVALALAWLACASLAAPARTASEEPASVRVVTELLPPYNFQEDGAVKGASTAVVRAVLERAGLRYTLEVQPWARALDTALHERNTLIYSIARTEEREKQLVWLGKICDRRLALFCSKERRDLLGHGLKDVPAATFAVIQGDASLDLLRKLGIPAAKLHVMRDARSPTAAAHVLEGRSDFFVSNPLRFEAGVRGTELEGRFQQHSVLWEGDGYYLAANSGSDAAIVGRVKDAFAALTASGTVKTLFDRALAQAE